MSRPKRESAIDRFGYAINTWDIQVKLTEAGIPNLRYQAPPGKSGFSNASPYWYLAAGGRLHYAEVYSGHLSDGSDGYKAGWRTWDDVVPAAEARGVHGPWMRPVGQAFDGLWVPASVEIPKWRRRKGDDGDSAPLKWVEGRPCSWTRFRTMATQDCHGLATESGLCKRHQSMVDRREREDAERAAARAERDAEVEQHSARYELEVERLEELKPLLEQIGLHPGVFEAVGKRVGRKVGVRAPSEALQELVRLAVVGYEIEEM
jgi:hypothetical protein